MKHSQAYEQMGTVDLEGRELEASVLLRAARKLNGCAKNWDQRGTPQFTEQLGDALRFTQRVWTFLQVEVSNPEHELPMSVRKSVFRLSKYVDKTVIKLYSGGTLPELTSLVNLNNEIAAGLSVRGPAAASQPAAEAQVPAGGSWG